MIEIRNLTKKRTNSEIIKKLYNKIFPPTGRAGHKKFELDVVLASPRLMLALNKKYRKKEKVADVLSFLLEKNRGEIFLNASEKNLPYLFVHGSLHLLGYDHKTNQDAKQMSMKELNIFTAAIITEETEGEEKLHDNTVKLVPLWKWLLAEEGL